MQAELGAQPLPYSGMPQFIQPIYPGFNGSSQQTSYNRNAALGLGIIQMIIGIICVILNSVLIAFNCCYFISYIAYGIWGGTLIIVAGLLQFLSAKKAENRCLIIGTMVMTIIASCASAVIIGFSVYEAISGDDIKKYRYYYETYPSFASFFRLRNRKHSFWNWNRHGYFGIYRGSACHCNFCPLLPCRWLQIV